MSKKLFALSRSDFINTKSINFDGTDQYGNVPDPSDFHYESGGSDSPFSVEAWVKPTVITNFRILVKGDVNDREWAFRFTGSNTLMLILNGTADGVTFIRRISTATLVADQGAWHHYVATYDASATAAGIKLYRDGSLISGTTGAGGSYVAMRDSGDNVRLASWECLDFSTGLFNSTSIYNKELSSAEISELYNSGVPLNPKKLQTSSDLELWLRGNRVSSAVSLDGSGNDHDTTLINSPTIVEDTP